MLPFYARYVYNFVSAEKWYFSVYTHTTGVNKLNYRGSVSCGEVSVCSQHPTIWLFRTSIGKSKRYNITQTKIIHTKIAICIQTKSLKKNYGPEVQETTKCKNNKGNVMGSKYPNTMNEAQHQSMQPCEHDCEDRSWMQFDQDCGRTTRTDMLFTVPPPPVNTNAVPLTTKIMWGGTNRQK
jgi:hypothetical protein